MVCKAYFTDRIIFLAYLQITLVGTESTLQELEILEIPQSTDWAIISDIFSP